MTTIAGEIPLAQPHAEFNYEDTIPDRIPRNGSSAQQKCNEMEKNKTYFLRGRTKPQSIARRGSCAKLQVVRSKGRSRGTLKFAISTEDSLTSSCALWWKFSEFPWIFRDFSTAEPSIDVERTRAVTMWWDLVDIDADFLYVFVYFRCAFIVVENRFRFVYMADLWACFVMFDFAVGGFRWLQKRLSFQCGYRWNTFDIIFL